MYTLINITELNWYYVRNMYSYISRHISFIISWAPYKNISYICYSNSLPLSFYYEISIYIIFSKQCSSSISITALKEKHVKLFFYHHTQSSRVEASEREREKKAVCLYIIINMIGNYPCTFPWTCALNGHWKMFISLLVTFSNYAYVDGCYTEVIWFSLKKNVQNKSFKVNFQVKRWESWNNLINKWFWNAYNTKDEKIIGLNWWKII